MAFAARDGGQPLDREDGMKSEEMAWRDYAAASAGALGLVIEPEWQAAVCGNLQTVFKLAALVEAFSLPDETEPAPVFEA
jgi:Protein of unknown function (DUF4089)